MCVIGNIMYFCKTKLARINNPELFNKLYNLEVKSAAEAFASALRPLWIHEYY